MKTQFKNIILVSSFATLLISCSYPMGLVGLGNQDQSGMDESSSASLNPELQASAMQILSQNCTACHTDNSGPGNIYGLTNVNHLVSTGLIVPGAPDQSYLLNVINGGSMPPSGPLSQADKETLRQWVAGGGNTGSGGSTGGGTSGPSPTPTPSPSPGPMPTDLQGQALRIISQNCTACHGETSGSGGIYGLTNTERLVSTGLVVPGNSAGSRLYTVIQSGKMPVGRVLAAADQDVIRRWIDTEFSASPNPQPIPAPKPEPTFKYISSEILTPKCVSCHNATTRNGGYAFDTYTAVLRAVDKSRPTDSDLYKEPEDGSMPPRPGTPLTSEQLRLILTWIQNGAQNN
ncbi:c-type cytochrome domain-containing protein [Bdellovibrio sp. HCB2-146]|uniref:c-type cytochrome domain-containing protein n=1 Tax=Bdellovibrio sp. HCB2-146 TaxID=3394362 RepID=UPI0039BCD139